MVAHIDTDCTVHPYSGDTRYATAAQGVLDAFPHGSDGVVIASGEGYADAISASGLAGALGYPVMITASTYLPAETTAAIDALRSGRDGFRIIVVGGETSVSGDVFWVLGSTYGWGNLERLYGATRYDTCAAVCAAAPAGSWGGTAVVCSGTGYADALSASAYAYAAKAPVLLAGEGGYLSQSELSAVEGDPSISRVVLVGGDAVLPESVGSLFPGRDTVRVSGDTRYSTSAAVCGFAASDGVLSWSDCGFATGDAFPDALAAGPAQGSRGGMLLLASSSDYSADEPVVEALASAGGADDVRWYGGPAAISDVARAYLLDAANGRY